MEENLQCVPDSIHIYSLNDKILFPCQGNHHHHHHHQWVLEITRNIQTLCLQGTSCEGRRQSEANYNQTISTLCDCPGRKQAQGAMGAERKDASFPWGWDEKKKIPEYRPLMKLRPHVYVCWGAFWRGFIICKRILLNILEVCLWLQVTYSFVTRMDQRIK